MFSVCVACLAVFCADLAGAVDFSQTEIANLKRVITALMDCQKIPGVSIAIIRDSAREYVQTFGMRDAHFRRPMQTNTVLCQSDLTQGFTATLTASAISQKNGSADWDAPLRNVLGKHFNMQVCLYCGYQNEGQLN